MTSSNKDTQDGTIGFSPQLAGHAKANKSHTSSFGESLPENFPVPDDQVSAGQEESGRIKQPNTSSAGRILPQVKDADIASGGSDSETDSDPAREKTEQDKQLPLHDEPIGGA